VPLVKRPENLLFFSVSSLPFHLILNLLLKPLQVHLVKLIALIFLDVEQ